MGISRIVVPGNAHGLSGIIISLHKRRGKGRSIILHSVKDVVYQYIIVASVRIIKFYIKEVCIVAVKRVIKT